MPGILFFPLKTRQAQEKYLLNLSQEELYDSIQKYHQQLRDEYANVKATLPEKLAIKIKPN